MVLPVLLWGVVLISAVDTSPQYNVRPRSPLCVKSNAACSADDSCAMLYFPVNSTACSNLSFATGKTQVKRLTLGSVGMQSYLYQDRTYSQTAFNMTFSRTSWTDMTFRIMASGNAGKNTCRRFTRSVNSSVESIAYDCIWSDERYEGKPFVLDYEARSGEIVESARILFTVPLAKGIERSRPREEWQLLVLVETVPTRLGRTILNVLWPPAPADMEVECYRVYVLYNESGLETVMHSSDVCQCEKELCAFTTQMWYGSIRFGVQPLLSNAVDGYIAKTQYFELGGQARPLLLGIVTCSILVPIILYLMLLLRTRVARRAAQAAPPKILVVYSPSTAPHLRVVEALVRYLNKHCRVTAWMDELNIPTCPSKDPFVWCAEAIESADVVCVVASPFFGQLRSSSALYRTDRLLLRLLREQYAVGGKTRYCVLIPPYATSADIPIEASMLQRLRLPRDLDSLVQLARFRWPLPSCLVPASAGGYAEYPELGHELAECFTAAAADLRDNGQLYARQVLEARSQDPARRASQEDPLPPHSPSAPMLSQATASPSMLSQATASPSMLSQARERDLQASGSAQRKQLLLVDNPLHTPLLDQSFESSHQLLAESSFESPGKRKPHGLVEASDAGKVHLLVEPSGASDAGKVHLLVEPSGTSDERKEASEDDVLAKKAFLDFPSNLDHLNLLGDKEDAVVIAETRPLISNFDLDALNL